MRRPRIRIAFALIVTLTGGGCHTYLPSPAPPTPAAEIVRIPFARPQVLVLARGERSTGDALDTLRGVTAVYGRVVALRGDTLELVVTRLSVHGAPQQLTAARRAAIDVTATTGVERWGHDREATRMVLTGAVVVLAAAVVIAAAALSQWEQD